VAHDDPRAGTAAQPLALTLDARSRPRTGAATDAPLFGGRPSAVLSRCTLHDEHVRAVARLALTAHGFEQPRAELARRIRRARQVGCWYREVGLIRALPEFARPSYTRLAELDPHLWDRLPYAAAFGYDQAALWREVRGGQLRPNYRLAAVAAAFNLGISLLDYAADERGQGALVFELLDTDVVGRLFSDSKSAERLLADRAARAPGERLCVLLGLVAACARGFADLHATSRNDRAHSALAQLVRRLYEAQRAVTVGPRATLVAVEAKSVLPFDALRQIVALAEVPRPDLEPPEEAAALALGRVVWMADDLADVGGDWLRHRPNRFAQRLANDDAGRRTEIADADVYALVDEAARELVGLLRPEVFGPPGLPLTDAVSRFARLAVAMWLGPEDDASGSAEPRRRGQSARRSPAVRRAVRMLCASGRDGYREAVHHLPMPRIEDGSIREEVWAASLFQRAVVLESLLEARRAGLAVPASRLAADAIWILRAKHRGTRGGWSYVPAVAELPPDADDLGLVLRALLRLGGQPLAAACEEPIALALGAQDRDGGLSTWVLDEAADPSLTSRMRAYVEVTDSGDPHPEVVANFLDSLVAYDARRYGGELRRGAAYLESAQDPDGMWQSRWYAGSFYGTYRAASVLAAVAPHSPALERARTALLQRQGPGGGWGDDGEAALPTALALLSLAAVGEGFDTPRWGRGRRFLLARQEGDGGWPAEPFLSFRDSGELEIYGSRTITTALCLQALLARPGVAHGSAPAGRTPTPPAAASSASGWS
jgi:Squalene-hopene cyclase C-terminal domain